MAGTVEAEVQINVKADTSQASQQLNELSKEFENINKSAEDSSNGLNILGNALSELGGDKAKTIMQLGEALGLSSGELAAVGGAAGVAVAGMMTILNSAKSMDNTFKAVTKTIGKDAVESIQWFINGVEDVINITTEAVEKLQEFAEQGVDIQNSYVTLGNFLGNDVVDNLNKYANSLESLKGLDATGVIADLSALSNAVGGLTDNSDELEVASKALYEYALNLHGAFPSIVSTTQAVEELSNAINNKRISKTGALGQFLSKEEIEQFSKLGDAVARYNWLMEHSNSVRGAYNAYLETESGKIEILKQQYNSFMGNLSQIALALFATVAPVLTKILSLANGVLTALMKVFNINVQKGTSVGAGGGLKGIAGDISNVGSAAKKATKQVASFDDVIQINDSKSGGIGGGFNPTGLNDYSSLLDDIINKEGEAEDIWKHFKELLDAGDYEGAGAELINVIAGQLEGIDWESIKNKASNAGKIVSDFINGMTNPSNLKNFNLFGKTIAEVFNTIFVGARSFIENLHFRDLGKSLGAMWKGLFENINTEDAGKALYGLFVGIFKTALGWLDEGGGFTTVATTLSNIIKEFFGSFENTDLDGITATVIGIISDIINAISKVAESLTNDDTKKIIMDLITKLMTAFKNNSDEWGKKLHDAIASVMDLISEAISTADENGLLGGIYNFLSNLGLADLLGKYMHIQLQILLNKILIWLMAGWNSIGKFLLTPIVFIAGLIGMALNLLYNAGAEFGEWLVNGVAEIGQTIGTFLGTIIGWVVGHIMLIGMKIGELVNKAQGAMAQLGSIIADKINSIKQWFSDLWQFIKDIFNPVTWANLAKDAISSLASGISNVWDSTLGGKEFNFLGKQIKIPSLPLAEGGVVSQATRALIGEAGPEAVIPLKKNAEWMRALASEIAGQMVTTGAGGTVKVSLSDKPFYTKAEMYEFAELIVKSLKVYGLNVAIV